MKSTADSTVASTPITVGKAGGCSPPRSSEHPREDQLLSEIGTARREALVGKLLLASWQDRVVWYFWRAMSSLPRATWPEPSVTTAEATRCNQGSPRAVEPLLHCKGSHCRGEPVHHNWRVTLLATTGGKPAQQGRPSPAQIKSSSS